MQIIPLVHVLRPVKLMDVKFPKIMSKPASAQPVTATRRLILKPVLLSLSCLLLLQYWHGIFNASFWQRKLLVHAISEEDTEQHDATASLAQVVSI